MAEFRSIIADIKKGLFAPVYILMGEEPYYIDRITEALESKVVNEEDKEFDQTVLYGADCNPGMILEAAGRFPMMSEKRLVVLKEAQAMRQAKSSLDKLSGYMSKPNPATILVVAFKGDKLNATSALIKSVKQNKDIIVFESPRLRDYNVGRVVKDYCISERIDIEERAIDLLVANVGVSLSQLFSEIEKLKVSLAGKNHKITLDLVYEHVGVSKEFNNFELITALSKRDYFQAVNIVKHFEENPKSNPSAATVAQIFTYFQKLLLVAFSSDKSDKSIMETLQLKNTYALREVKTGLSNYNASQLVNAIHAIRAFDTKSKGIGSFQKEFSLLLELVCTIITL